MAGAKHGSKLVFKVDDSGGTPRDLTAYTDNVSWPMPVDMAESSTAGLTSKTYVPGLKDSTVQASGKYDSTVTSGPDVVLFGLLGAANTATVEYHPGGSATGEAKYTAEAWLTNYTPQSPIGGVVTWSATFQVTGAVTRAVN